MRKVLKEVHVRIKFFPKSTLAALFLLATSCGNFEQAPESLARKHCSTCHSYTDPSYLTKSTWSQGVLPEMAYRMGLDLSRLPMASETELNAILTTIPATPPLTNAEWEAIEEYYLMNAPDSLRTPRKQHRSPLTQFTASEFKLPVNNNTVITMIKYDDKAKMLFAGTRRGILYRLNTSLEIQDTLDVGSPPSDLVPEASGKHIVSLMGIMDPNDLQAGSMIGLSSDKKETLTLIDSLKRPVDIEITDLNNDGQEDLIVSAFGNFTGALFVYEKTENNYRRHLLHSFPGTRKTIVRDFNEDGLSDILVLITQGDEKIALFTNRGDFRFSYQVLLRFPPVYGSSYFELCDFNKDGKEDILYTNGDNADYSAILKPYHGVRIFLNDGKNHFRESQFFPMYGASMARACDFDEDGDNDIAAISFFPDFENYPEHSFIYFENNNGSFTPYITPLAASSRWITMESADIDHDHDTDLILGALTFPNGVPDSLFKTWRQDKTSFLILRNNLRDKQ